MAQVSSGFLNRYDAPSTNFLGIDLYLGWLPLDTFAQALMPTVLGDWFHAGGYQHFGVERNGKIYQLMYWVNDHYHFQVKLSIAVRILCPITLKSICVVAITGIWKTYFLSKALPGIMESWLSTCNATAA